MSLASTWEQRQEDAKPEVSKWAEKVTKYVEVDLVNSSEINQQKITELCEQDILRGYPKDTILKDVHEVMAPGPARRLGVLCVGITSDNEVSYLYL